MKAKSVWLVCLMAIVSLCAVTANPADYEAYVCRAFARVVTLWGEDDVKYFATGCGLDFDPETEYEYKIDALTGAIVGTKKKLDIF